MTVLLEGIGASTGVAIGKIYMLVEPDLSFQKEIVENSDNEKQRFHEAVFQTKVELKNIRTHAASKMGEEEAKIFDAHDLILTDPEWIQAVEAAIEAEKQNAEAALWSVTDMFIQLFENMENNEYMKERAADIHDVRKRVMSHLLGVSYPDLTSIQEEVILIADDLSPSDTAQLDKAYIQAFITEKGGKTSHSAIMARSLEIPAVVGIKQALQHLTHDSWAIVDGLTGTVLMNPSNEEIEKYRKKQRLLVEEQKEWRSFAHKPSVTKDARHVTLAANISSLRELSKAKENGAEGIGLFRTEFLYMESADFPDEENQFLVYKELLEQTNEQRVVVRTMDIGGDKHLSYMPFSSEMNPFLGYRAIRMSLKEDHMFRVQIRALLRASVYGTLSIMFPLVATLEELRQAKRIVKEETERLKEENIPVSDSLQLGMMIETPAAALLADHFAREVDFFSIGTNDLIQYTLAADRMNEHVSYLYQPLHPSLLRMIKLVIDAAHTEGIWVGMCGEVAGDSLAIPLLIGLGLDEFSMTASSIPKVRHLLTSLDSKKMKELASEAVTMCGTYEEVKALVERALL